MTEKPRLDLGHLADLVDGRLGPEARQRAEQALAADPEAQQTARWFRGFLQTAQAVPLEPASPLLEQRLSQYYDRWIRAQEVLSTPVERVRAELVYDSRQEPALAGVRGGALLAEEISLLWECDQGELSVEILPAEDGRPDEMRLLGQVLLNVETGAPFFEASAVTGGVRRAVESDEFGRFRIESLPRLDTELRVSNGLLQISAGIDLGRRTSGPAESIGPVEPTTELPDDPRT